MLQLLLLLLRALLTGLRSRRDLALENLVLRHQLHVVLRTNPNPGLRNRDRVLWVWVRLLWPKGWRQHLLVVQPETVIRWHRKGWQLYWSWKLRTRLGRPRLSREGRELIHFNVTASPTAAWIWQQLLEATPWGRQPAHLIHRPRRRLRAGFRSARGTARHQRSPDATSGAESELDRGKARGDHPQGVSRSRHRGQRGSSPKGAG
jgi:hypothetical protein